MAIEKDELDPIPWESRASDHQSKVFVLPPSVPQWTAQGWQPTGRTCRGPFGSVLIELYRPPNTNKPLPHTDRGLVEEK